MRSGLWKLVVVLAVLLQAACSPPRSIEALLVVADIAAGPGESRLKAATAPPVRKTINYAFEGRIYAADVYWPGSKDTAEAVTVLVPGVVRLGKDDPRLVAFAHTLARARFLVFVPDLVNLRQLNGLFLCRWACLAGSHGRREPGDCPLRLCRRSLFQHRDGSHFFDHGSFSPRHQQPMETIGAKPLCDLGFHPQLRRLGQ
jgi:hypothetical protein